MEITENKVILAGVMIRKDMHTYFIPREDLTFKTGDLVVVKKNEMVTLGKITRPYVKMDAKLYDKLKERFGIMRILRRANEDDLKYFENLAKKENNAFKICKQKIKEHGLPMHLIETVWDESEKEYVFYFTADSRVDFRALVKDLVSTFNTKIKLWQVGARDAMKFFGGVGPCGYPICCTNFLKDIESIELTYAKMQNLPMNVSKITGACGRLVCCLRYELKEGEPIKLEQIKLEDINFDGKE
ncbi:regulatory iron-sulfur-containing complex subunit RicT [Caldisericum sp.]|uniref:regulatory iron-sulfur-containing complex subunit RicT n=1 Tax=Caldisericum sp. TaxID=2499687 RepID=UPI003D114B40